MALSTRKKNIIIADLKTGAFTTYSSIAVKHKIDAKTAKNIIINSDDITKKNKIIRSKDRSGYIYLLRAGDTDYYKIGITSGCVKTRASSVQSGNHLEITIVDFVKCGGINSKEKKLHKMFDNQRTIREWFIFKDITNVLNEFSSIRLKTSMEQ